MKSATVSILIAIAAIEYLGATLPPATIRVYAPLGTPIVALCALGVAIYSISAQKQIARRRAAIDFFLKTDVDKDMAPFYYEVQDVLKQIAPTEQLPDRKDKDYVKLRRWFNIVELMAVGIKESVFSEKVCREYWGAILPRDYRAAEWLIKAIRTNPEHGSPATYCELERLALHWERKQHKIGA